MTFESTSDDPERRLFMDALGEDAGPARAAWLKRECGSDVALLRRLEALLRAHEEQTTFLPDEKGGGFDSPTERAGEHIGRYKLLQELGEGGFGVVWMAEQIEPVSRRVALKIIKMGMDTREVIARFEAERQALAMMDHPNIARVLDAGATDKGRPFFVMELVKGIPITQFCDEKQLGTRERLLLFGDVCSAINHAHQKGIIHRDIKPSNVMVTLHCDKAVPKVIDFGIAKATLGKLTDKTLFTRFEQFIGTPVYMSPEQAAMGGLDIDTRSDIYSLGILLYELLTGTPPFDAKSLASAGHEEMRRIIREEEPPKPSSRLSTVAGEDRTALARAMHVEPEKLDRMVEPDLDWIVMKAIEKDRTRRYDTVNGLALDIERFLSDEPVSARPPSAGYKFRKFARRNQTALRVTAAITAVLVGGTIVSTWQAVRATKAGRLAADAGKLAADRLAQVAAERDAKDEARKDAEEISNFLAQVFQSPDPSRDGRTITVAETLDDAAKKLETGLAGQPAHRARLQLILGETYHALGLWREAIPLQESARKYALASHGPEHRLTLDAITGLALSCHGAGRRQEGLKLQETAVELSRKMLGAEHPGSLAALNNLATFCADAGRADEALRLREEVLALRRKVLGPNHTDTLGAMNNLALSYANAGRGEEALKLREELLPLRLRTDGPEHPDTLKAMGNLALSFFDAGRRDEAIKLEREVLTLSRKVLGREHAGTLDVMGNLAHFCDGAGLHEEALKLREEVLAISCEFSGPEHPDTLAAMGNLALSCLNAGRPAEALKLREEALSLSRKVNGAGHPGTLMAMSGLAFSYADTGRRDEALRLREEVLWFRRKVSGPEHPDTLGAMNNLALSYADARRGEEALKLREELLPLRLKTNGPEHPETLKAMGNLALSCWEAGRIDESIRLGEEVLALRRKVIGPEHPETLHGMGYLASAFDSAGRQDVALKLREEKLPLCRKVHGAEHPETLGAMTNLAISYGAAGRLPEAILLQEQSLAIKRRVLPPNHPYLAAALGNLANFYERDGRTVEADALRKELAGKQ